MSGSQRHVVITWCGGQIKDLVFMNLKIQNSFCGHIPFVFTLQGFINWTSTAVGLENEVTMSFIPESNEFIIISTNEMRLSEM